jgi:hypothetical protein
MLLISINRRPTKAIIDTVLPRSSSARIYLPELSPTSSPILVLEASDRHLKRSSCSKRFGEEQRALGNSDNSNSLIHGSVGGNAVPFNRAGQPMIQL